MALLIVGAILWCRVSHAAHCAHEQVRGSTPQRRKHDSPPTVRTAFVETVVMDEWAPAHQHGYRCPPSDEGALMEALLQDEYISIPRESVTLLENIGSGAWGEARQYLLGSLLGSSWFIYRIFGAGDAANCCHKNARTWRCTSCPCETVARGFNCVAISPSECHAFVGHFIFWPTASAGVWPILSCLSSQISESVMSLQVFLAVGLMLGV